MRRTSMVAAMVALLAGVSAMSAGVDSAASLMPSDATASASASASKASGETKESSSSVSPSGESQSSASDSPTTEKPHKRTAPVIHHHTKKHHTKKHHPAARHHNKMHHVAVSANATNLFDVCQDLSPDWRNKLGLTCKMYATAWCNGHGVVNDKFTGEMYDFPERACCVCGGGEAKTLDDGTKAEYEPPSSMDSDSDDADDTGDADDADSSKTSGQGCMNTPGWKNQYGLDCIAYMKKRYCLNGGFVTGFEWTGGAYYGFPEKHCCDCHPHQ